jgi:hypothetical protein
MEEDFLEGESFFFPTPELTKSLFAAVAWVRRSDQISASEDREQAENVDGDYVNNLSPVVAAGVNSASPPKAGAEDEELYIRQRFIAEELYHHLAFLCRSPPAKRGNSLPTREAVAHGMGDVLGLPQDDPLLGRLEGEFNEWLGKLGQFPAGWGKIILAEGRQIYLVERDPAERDAVNPPRRVFIPRQPDPRERAGRRRAAGGGKKSD